jgi:hypothetical protein
VYLLHLKKKWYASSRGTPQAQVGLDTIFDLNKSLFEKEAEHRSCVNITFKFRGPYMKCLGTIFISFTLFSNVRLNFNGVSGLRTEFSSLFHSPTKEGINDEFVEERLQKGTIRSLPLRRLLYFD